MKKTLISLFLISLSFCSKAQHIGDFVIFHVAPHNQVDAFCTWFPFFVATELNEYDSIHGFIFGNPEGNFGAYASGYMNLRKCHNQADAENPGECWSTITDAKLWGRAENVTENFRGSYEELTDKPDHGSTTFSGVSLQTQYTVTHGLNYTPAKIFIQPKSTDAAALCYVDNITATTFRITFNTVPVIGSNNIAFDWIAYR